FCLYLLLLLLFIEMADQEFDNSNLNSDDDSSMICSNLLIEISEGKEVECMEQEYPPGCRCYRFDRTLKEADVFLLLAKSDGMDVRNSSIPLVPPDSIDGSVSFAYPIDLASLANTVDIQVDGLRPWGTKGSRSTNSKPCWFDGNRISFKGEGPTPYSAHIYHRRHSQLPRLRKYVVSLRKDGIPVHLAIIVFVFEISGPSYHTIKTAEPIDFVKRQAIISDSSTQPPSKVAAIHGISRSQAQYYASFGGRAKQNKGPVKSEDEKAIDEMVIDGKYIQARLTRGATDSYIISSAVLNELFIKSLVSRSKLEKDRQAIDDFFTNNPDLLSISERFGGIQFGECAGMTAVDVTFDLCESRVVTIMSFWAEETRNSSSGKIGHFPVALLVSPTHTKRDLKFLYSEIDARLSHCDKGIRGIITDQEAALSSVQEFPLGSEAQHLFCSIHIERNISRCALIPAEDRETLPKLLFGSRVEGDVRKSGILDEINIDRCRSEWSERKSELQSEAAVQWVESRLASLFDGCSLRSRCLAGVNLLKVSTNGHEAMNSTLKDKIGRKRRSLTETLTDLIAWLRSYELELMRSIYGVGPYKLKNPPFDSSLQFHLASDEEKARRFSAIGLGSLCEVVRYQLASLPNDLLPGELVVEIHSSLNFFLVTTFENKRILVERARKGVVYSVRSAGEWIVMEEGALYSVKEMDDGRFTCGNCCKQAPCVHMLIVFLSVPERWEEISTKLNRKKIPDAGSRAGMKPGSRYHHVSTSRNHKRVVHELRRRSRSIAVCEASPIITGSPVELRLDDAISVPRRRFDYSSSVIALPRSSTCIECALFGAVR
ncbi:hypothetical protein PFISCL1PPCAC_16562, partial [Pristionchus fissidentatus]